jgi:hypothetical protein
MRAKDEFRYIAETYNTKLLLERVVDGKLMCPEACCGSPVLECKCGEDCEHCNCFMIQKAIKSNGLTDKLLKEFYKMRDPDGDGSWPDDDDDRDHPDYGEPEYDDRGTGEIGREDEERVRLTLDSPGTASVHLPKGDPRIQKYLDHGYKIVKDYKKATQSEDAESDAGLWRDQMKHQPDVSPEEVERLKNKPRPKKTGRLTQPENEEDKFNRLENKRERARDRAREAEDKGDWDEWNRQENERERSRDQLRDIEDNEDIEYENPATRRKEAQRAANERAHKKWQDPEYWKKFGVKGLGLDTPKEDNEEPKRSITGMKHKLDALAAAQLAGSKHKPYVSSFVGSGGKKIFAILGSDGKIAHKTHDKREAHQWLKDNYENI